MPKVAYGGGRSCSEKVITVILTCQFDALLVIFS